ncbi:MAG: metal ABC transporter permease [Rhodothermales bacterium]|nr:metal ABC transporter permease [Rhodothermales bacterium]
MEFLAELFTDYTLRTVALGSAVLGITSGTLGTFAVLRQQSLLGDAISHAALPGIAIAFILTGSKVPLALIAGAAVAGWVATMIVSFIAGSTRIKYDSALGLVLAVFFGLGLVLLTFIQQSPNANQAGLNSFLFGQAASLIVEDVLIMGAVGLVSVACVAMFWKEFKLLSFDPEFGRTVGLPTGVVDAGLTTLLVLSIVIGLQTVGVVLMSAMIIAPAAAARQWTDRLGSMVLLSALFGAVSGVGGAMISSHVPNLPTGPTIVLFIGVIVMISFFLAPNRGIAWRLWREWRNGRRLRLEAVLLDLWALSVQHDRSDHPHEEAVLNIMSDPTARTRQNLRILEERGFARQINPTLWSLTRAGVARAQAILDRDNQTNNAANDNGGPRQ